MSQVQDCREPSYRGHQIERWIPGSNFDVQANEQEWKNLWRNTGIEIQTDGEKEATMFIKLRYNKMDPGRGKITVFIGEDKKSLQMAGDLVLYSDEWTELLLILYGGIHLWNEKLPDKRFGIEIEGAEGFEAPDLIRKLELED